eukprot:2614057-Prymnesium_polylepis.1
MSLSLWLDVQCSSQLREEQPRCSSRRANERGVEQRAQRRDRGAARTRGRGRALVSGSAHRLRKWPRAAGDDVARGGIGSLRAPC